jgi:NADPH-dependent 2,4-dienoyl-CoA reductase/sulfur reductase-like enzyme
MGAAGVAAALTARRLDPAGRITIVTKDPYLYYSRPGLAYLLAGEIPTGQLNPFSKTLFDQNRIRILTEAVFSIDLKNQRLALGGNQTLGYDRLLIATGASAQMPDVPGIKLDGVVKLDSYDDAQCILKAARRTKTAVVVGGGITALELVEGLVAQGICVHYFLRGERYWSSVLDEVESRIVERRLAEDGVKIHYHTELAEVIGKRGAVVGVRAVEDGCEISLPCQMLAVAIGIRPRLSLAAKAGLDVERGILVSPQLRTRAENVFAAGDVAQVFDPQKGEYLLDSLWGPALEMGRVAGANMTGASLTYIKKYPFNVTRLAGLVTTIIGRVGRSENGNGKRPRGDADLPGIMRGDSEVWRLEPEAEVAQTFAGDNRLRLYIRGDRLVGAVVMGDQTLSYPIQRFIQAEMDIGPIREQLLAENADLAAVIGSYWSARKHAAEIS